MKVVLRSAIIVTLSVCCIQIIVPQRQPVVAKKKKLTDVTPVTVTITAGNKASKSTFRKSSGWPADKLYFDFSQGDNMITVDYKGKSGTKELGGVRTRKSGESEEYIRPGAPEVVSQSISRIVTQEDAPKGSEIVLDGTIIEIDASKSKGGRAKIFSISTPPAQAAPSSYKSSYTLEPQAPPSPKPQ